MTRPLCAVRGRQSAGRRRSPATLASFHEGRAPHNKGCGIRLIPTVEEIISVMRAAGDDADGVRLRALIIAVARRITDQ
jgi:hypothetical protein